MPGSVNFSSDEEDDIPLARRRSRVSVPMPVVSTPSDEEDSEEEMPLSKRARRSSFVGNGKSTPNGSKATNGSTKKREAAADSSPRKRVKKEKDAPSKKESKAQVKQQVKKVKKESKAPTKKASVKKEAENGKVKSEEPEENDEEDDEVHKWWETIDETDHSIKWTTLEHNGVLFPPPYEPLPKHVRLLYDGKPVELSLEAEEVAGFFGAMLSSDHCQNPVFQTNFFTDFVQVVKETGGAKIGGVVTELKSFEKCDFNQVFEYYEQKRAEKKALTSAEKKAIKAEKDEMEEMFKTCIMDGRKQPVGNFRIEPPGLFRGRGAHPKTGKLKARVKPEQVTINIGKDVKAPEPPEGHNWAEVKHDNTVAWLATWKENINGSPKYVLLAHSSSLKGMSDYKKFEKARELKNHVEHIRKNYRKELDDKVMENRQRATAMYLIDVLALRAGGEKGEDEADTVGCCSLRYEHITLEPPNIVHFDFLGKDSIRYQQSVEVDAKVFRNLRIFKKAPKKEGDDIFDRLDPPTLNKHLQNYMPGLTAKVFRTYNASFTMQQQLEKIPNVGTVNEKVVAFNAANRAVAILCNHQRTVSKGHEASIGKIEDKLLELKWNKIRIKKAIVQLEPKLRKKDPKYFEEIGSLDKEKIQDIQEKILEREKIKIERKFVKDNEKLLAEGEKKMPDSELKMRLEVLKEMEKEFKAERNGKTPEIKGSMTVEKLQAQVEKLEERIANTSLQLKDKEDNSQVALGTSKMNYIDPRLTVMFSKKFNVPIEKLFTKTLREKFNWALQSADENWKF